MSETSTRPRESLAKSGLVSLFGSAFAAVSALLLTVIIGRGHGAEGAGLFFQAIGVFSILAGALKLGTTSGLVRAMAREKALDSPATPGRLVVYALVPVLVASALVALGLYWGADPLAARLTNSEEAEVLSEILKIFAPMLIVAAVLSVLHTAIRMTHGVVAFTILQNALIPVGRILLVVAAILAGWDAKGAVVAWLGLLPLWLLLAAGIALQQFSGQWRGNTTRGQADESFGSFWRFTSGRATGAAVEVALEWSDVLVVAALRPAWEAGVYAVVTRANRAGQVADRALRVAVSPTFAGLLAVGDTEDAARLHTTATKALVLITWPFYLTLITMGPAVLSIFGGEFIQGAKALALLSTASLLAALGGMLQSIMLMGGQSSWQVYNKGFVLILSIAGNLLLVPKFGYTGAALWFMVVVGVDTLIAALIVQRGVGVRLHPTRLIPTTALPLVFFGGFGVLVRLAFPSTPLSLAIYLLGVGCTYLVCMWLLRHRLGLDELLSARVREATP